MIIPPPKDGYIHTRAESAKLTALTGAGLFPYPLYSFLHIQHFFLSSIVQDAVEYQENYKGKSTVVTEDGRVLKATIIDRTGGGLLSPIIDGKGYIPPARNNLRMRFRDPFRKVASVRRIAKDGFAAPTLREERVGDAASVFRRIKQRICVYARPVRHTAKCKMRPLFHKGN